MQAEYPRHDISDRAWEILEPHLLGRKGTWEGNAKDNRRVINGVFWILRTGAPWRDLPTDYGDWKNTHRRFCRWRGKRIWEGLLEIVRHLVEKAFLGLKRWRGIATRYAKNTASFLAAVHIRSVAIWAKIY